LSITSISLPYWLRSFAPNDLPDAQVVDYGLYRRCETRLIAEPYQIRPHLLAVNDKPDGGLVPAYVCTPFPPRSVCRHDGESFCIAWWSAGYLSQIGLVLATLALFTLMLVVIVSSRAGRRNAWKFISVLVGLHGVLQITAMGLVTGIHGFHLNHFARNTKFGISYWLNTTTWVLDMIVIAGLAVTGIYAEKGHRWAAGRRPYHPIPG